MPPIPPGLSAGPFDPDRGLLARLAQIGLNAYLVAEGVLHFTPPPGFFDIVQDGGFEQAVGPSSGDPNSQLPQYPDGTSAVDLTDGWHMQWAAVVGGSPHSGKQCINLTGGVTPQPEGAPSAAGGVVSQTLATQKGRTYALSFFLAGDPVLQLAPSSPASFGFSVGGLSYGATFSYHEGQPVPPSGYVSYGRPGDAGGPLTFTALSAETLLSFSATSSGHVYLDDVSVLPVDLPSPAAAPALVRVGLLVAGLGLGLALVGAVTARQARRP